MESMTDIYVWDFPSTLRLLRNVSKSYYKVVAGFESLLFPIVSIIKISVE